MKTNDFKVLAFLLVSLTASAFACEKESMEKLLKMQQLWNSQNSTDYSYVVKKQCFCSPAYTREMQVLVVNNTVTDARYVDTNEKVSKEIIEQLVTISEWFNQIARATDNKLGEVEVVYNDMLGYPENIRIDQHKRRSDDELNIIISKVIKQ
jgi:hypothetical protein